MKFNNLWTKLAEIDEVVVRIKVLGLTIFSFDLDWSRKNFSLTLLNFNISTK